MIVVIADDLSGAAELANIAARHGLGVEVQTVFHPQAGADVICIDTDTRLLPPEQAARRTGQVAAVVIAARPEWVFKKCDSVLRGAVLAEARAVAVAAGCDRILMVPANPSRNRIVRGGHYFIGDTPLHETSFARDPTHPRTTSEVRALLGANPDGVTIPDARSAGDIVALTAKVDEATLPVGAADFFAALLAHRVTPGRHQLPAQQVPDPTLVVCGSAASWPQRRADAIAKDVPVFALPYDLAALTHALETKGCALVGVGDGPATAGQKPEQLVIQLAQLVTRVLQAITVRRLLLEGGATAAATLAALGWYRLRTVGVGDDGLGILQSVGANAPFLFIKPGSYPWPAGSWP